MKIDKTHIGKRLLVRKGYSYSTEPQEVRVLEISPSQTYVKLKHIRNDESDYNIWTSIFDYDVVEDLGYYQARCYLKSDSYTVTNKGYEETSNKILQEQIKKNKWVHGMCNPPSPDWKKTK